MEGSLSIDLASLPRAKYDRIWQRGTAHVRPLRSSVLALGLGKRRLNKPYLVGRRLRYQNVQATSMQTGSGDATGDGQMQGKVVTGGTGAPGVDEEFQIDLAEMLPALRQLMEEATAAEDFKEAARIRDLIHALEESDPILQTQRLLAKAIAEERYADASRHRDELKSLAPPEPEKPPAPTIGCTSDRVTKDVRVMVRSIYVRDRSTPSRQQYFFAYRIRISNEGPRTVQLLHRHWLITDANGRTEEVRGPGVIGEQPVLRPGGSFEYTSACPLRTPYGTMEGEYEMIYCDDPLASPFEVKVGPFALNVNNDEL